jgi:hypothetical protein
MFKLLTSVFAFVSGSLLFLTQGVILAIRERTTGPDSYQPQRSQETRRFQMMPTTNRMKRFAAICRVRLTERRFTA